MPISLNAKHLRFIELYQLSVLAGKPNATQAYIDAGYTANYDSARTNAARLLADANIQRLLAPAEQLAQQMREKAVERIEITRDRIRNELARVSFANPKRLFHPDGLMKDVHELDDDTACAIQSVEIEEDRRPGSDVVTRTRKVKFWNKIDALKALADTEPGVWIKQDGSGSTTNVNVAVLSDAELARRIDALEGRVAPSSGSERLLQVVADTPPEVQLDVAPPDGNPQPPPESH